MKMNWTDLRRILTDKGRLFRQNLIKGMRTETGVGMTPTCKGKSFRQMASIIIS
ncbi:hypothetical protein C806_04591 [Lachnospiraceae bacterium 3-1]|nr:hypothetical protein C806_04591 [Lachnospiraceae bacterium 3-1]